MHEGNHETFKCSKIIDRTKKNLDFSHNKPQVGKFSVDNRKTNYVCS